MRFRKSRLRRYARAGLLLYRRGSALHRSPAGVSTRIFHRRWVRLRASRKIAGDERGKHAAVAGSKIRSGSPACRTTSDER
jgi:hypothetical protein